MHAVFQVQLPPPPFDSRSVRLRRTEGSLERRRPSRRAFLNPLDDGIVVTCTTFTPRDVGTNASTSAKPPIPISGWRITRKAVPAHSQVNDDPLSSLTWQPGSLKRRRSAPLHARSGAAIRDGLFQ